MYQILPTCAGQSSSFSFGDVSACFGPWAPGHPGTWAPASRFVPPTHGPTPSFCWLWVRLVRVLQARACAVHMLGPARIPARIQSTVLSQAKEVFCSVFLQFFCFSILVVSPTCADRRSRFSFEDVSACVGAPGHLPAVSCLQPMALGPWPNPWPSREGSAGPGMCVCKDRRAYWRAYKV
jgi:hypothetical protein